MSLDSRLFEIFEMFDRQSVNSEFFARIRIWEISFSISENDNKFRVFIFPANCTIRNSNFWHDSCWFGFCTRSMIRLQWKLQNISPRFYFLNYLRENTNFHKNWNQREGGNLIRLIIMGICSSLLERWFPTDDRNLNI